MIEGDIQVKLCRIHRKGCNSYNDARAPVYLEDMIGVNAYQECYFFSPSGHPEITAQHIAATTVNK
ncbi:hypothetical protein vBSsoS008_019 [Shigella phage vB_SsoS_008]|nr:hypothetical protein vBSsoS008_019 [Shigella phage vB_SsoS_008]